MSEPKQWIVVRRDLNMPPGKLAAQVAHASVGAVLELFKAIHDVGYGVNDVIYSERRTSLHRFKGPLLDWLSGRFTKIVLGVDGKEELLGLADSVIKAGLPGRLILDQGLTVFKEPTYTCLSVGPALPEDVADYVGDLKLL